MTSELTDCLVLNTRMAARAITRRYDRELRPFGITAAQFSILGAIARKPDHSVTDMAATLAMERTTLSRNLDLLEGKGLIACRDGDSGNKRMCRLTAKGEALIERLMPEWRKAQAELRAMLTEQGVGELLSSLRKLSAL